MSEDEITAWVRMMGRTPRQQAERIAELLRFAHVDEMSAEDRAICRQQLARLQQVSTPERHA